MKSDWFNDDNYFAGNHFYKVFIAYGRWFGDNFHNGKSTFKIYLPQYARFKIYRTFKRHGYLTILFLYLVQYSYFIYADFVSIYVLPVNNIFNYMNVLT